MYLPQAQKKREGAILPMVAICLIAIFAMIALAIDLGIVTLARNQSQNAADLAALSGVRQLTGDRSDSGNLNNVNNVEPFAKSAAAENQVLSRTIQASEVTVKVGYYVYDLGQQKFEAVFDGELPAGESWGAAEVTVQTTHPTYFARVIGVNNFVSTATARSVHRPRDIAIVLDFSGSMRFSSETAYPSSGTIHGSLNPDDRIPRFGHWEPTSMQNIMKFTGSLYVDGGGETHAANNMTIETENGPSVVDDFLTRDGTGNLTSAFNTSVLPAPASYDIQAGTDYDGDKWPHKNDNPSDAYATTVKEYLDGDNNSLSTTHAKDTSFEPADSNNPTANDGYGPDFKGYSMGPGYYGKTFYVWPPDPRYHPTNENLQFDWRKKFFRYPGSSTPMDDNYRIWDSNGYQRQANRSDSYSINYDKVIEWIKSGPQVFPDNLRAGRVLYYSAIPDTIPDSGGSLDQRFWREYIDYVIGAGNSSEQARTLYGRADYGWGSVRITRKSYLNPDPDVRPYMYYRDNPRRPRLHYWFGPLSMLDFLAETNQNYRNWWPGTSHEAQTWQLKAGIQSALGDIELNHPNDNAALIYFSALNEFNTARVQMGKQFTRMQNALFFPFSLLDSLGNASAEIRPYDSGFDADVSNGELPNGHGGTSPEMGFKLAYNELSSRSGYYGRRGATKMVIFETDGVPNTTANGDFVNGGAYNSKYSGISNGSGLGNNNSTVISRTLDVVERITAMDTASLPGYSTSKNSARVHALAFGDLFQSSSYKKDQALDFLRNVQIKGKTSSAGASSIESYKIITGDFNTRISNLRNAMERIMQSGVQVSLIR